MDLEAPLLMRMSVRRPCPLLLSGAPYISTTCLTAPAPSHPNRERVVPRSPSPAVLSLNTHYSLLTTQLEALFLSLGILYYTQLNSDGDRPYLTADYVVDPSGGQRARASGSVGAERVKGGSAPLVRSLLRAASDGRASDRTERRWGSPSRRQPLVRRVRSSREYRRSYTLRKYLQYFSFRMFIVRSEIFIRIK